MNTALNNTDFFSEASQLIRTAQNIVLMPHAKMDCDGMSSALALYLFLKKVGKNPTAVCPDPVPEALDFLPSSEVFSLDLPEGVKEKNAYMVTVDTSKKGFQDLKYTVQNGKVNIMLFSEEAPLEESDFSFVGKDINPDLIITLDSGDTKQLGKIYLDNKDLFEQIPVINIDHHVSNTQFGDVNVVDFKSSSTAELIYKLFPFVSEKAEELFDTNIATLLLAGMLTDTGSFQHSNTTPAALDIAGDLISKGARHQEIVKHLFKTKSLATLRLWGRILTKLKNDPVYRMVWSSVSSLDLEETQAHSDETEGLIDELMATTPGTELVLLVKEREDDVISTSIRSSSPSVNSIEFSQKFGGGGHRQAAGFKIRERGGKSFEEIVSDIVFEAKKFQAQRLGINPPSRDLISEIDLMQNADLKTQHDERIDQFQKEKQQVPALPSSLKKKKNSSKKFDSQVSEEFSQKESENKEELPVGDSLQNILEKKAEGDLSKEEKEKLKRKKKREKYKERKKLKKQSELKKREGSMVHKKEGDVLIVEESEIKENMNKGEELPREKDNTVSSLSPEEKAYLNAPEYKMPEPEKEIEKQEYDSYIDDFADFISQAENDGYQSNQETSSDQNPTEEKKTISTDQEDLVSQDLTLQSPVQNIPEKTAEGVNSSVSKVLNPTNAKPQEDEFLKSLQRGEAPFLTSVEESSSQQKREG